VRVARETRERFVAVLRSLGYEPLPSAANFVFVPHPRAPVIARRLGATGIIVRAMSGLPTTLAALASSNGQALRIAVAPWPAMKRVLGALAEALR
jgi:histidinol-phosphate/aromatic aminotransferase/cobyric acid decarboxylase-like protein